MQKIAELLEGNIPSQMILEEMAIHTKKEESMVTKDSIEESVVYIAVKEDSLDLPASYCLKNTT